jgi:rhodanese-related sulfurtransferase
MRVAAALADAGFTDLTNVTGGIMAWEAAGLPIKTGR